MMEYNTQLYSNGALREHVVSVHYGRKYLCKHCDYQATQIVVLNKHVKSIHEKEKFLCGDCDTQFSQKSHLRRHQQSIHKLS